MTCGKGRSRTAGEANDETVARAGDLAITAGDLALAQRARPGDTPAALLRSLATDALVAQEARAALPTAAAEADKAEREAAVQLLLVGAAETEASMLRAYYDEHGAEFEQPAMVRYGRIVVASCQDAQALAAKIDAQVIDFTTAALQYSLDRESGAAGGESAWISPAALGAPTAAALSAVSDKGGLARPLEMADGRCELLRLIDRRPAARQPFEEVRSVIELRVAGHTRGEARAALLAKLGGVEAVRMDDAAIDAVFLAARPLHADLASRAVMTLGARSLTGADLAAAIPADLELDAESKARFVTSLAEDLLLYDHAAARGLVNTPRVGSAVRAALVGAMRSHIHAQIDEAALSPKVRERYDLATGDYTESRRVKVASLVTRDEAKAKAWVAALAKAKFTSTAFEKLLPQSEDESARRNGGDIGWIDARSTHVTDSFRDAALMLARPGAVSGVLQSSGVYHVLVCNDVVPEKVLSFEQVEPQIRAAIVEEERRQHYNAYVESVSSRVDLQIDQEALARALAVASTAAN